MKSWLTPNINSLSNQDINSGVYSDGAEQVLTCSGAVVAAPNTAFTFLTACTSYNPTGAYQCTGIITFFGGLVLSSSAGNVTIAQACS